MVGKLAPDFKLPCTHGAPSSRRELGLADYRGRWVILIFYPRDFSLVCPTELTAISTRIEEFRRRGCDVLAISTDSVESHERWIAAPRTQAGLGRINFFLGSDQSGLVSRVYGVYLENEHVALRGLFIIDPNGVAQYESVNNLSVGRRSDEILRILSALQSGGMCPENWWPDTPPLDAAQALGPGTVISHYRVEEKVGQGGFASVFRARDLMLHRTVALKVFKPGTLVEPRTVLAEACSAAALNHPNICTVFNVDDSEGVSIIVMAYLDGRPLSDLMQQGALPVSQVGAIGRQIASGMAAAHAQGIVHGDLKPANIILTQDGTVKITDFGLARRMARSQDSTSQASQDTTIPLLVEPGEVGGTPGYVAPEQCNGATCSPASDVFSLGAILYEMITGEKAFKGKNVLEMFECCRSVDPEEYAAKAPEPFRTILRQALARDSQQRCITMEQIAAILIQSEP